MTSTPGADPSSGRYDRLSLVLGRALAVVGALALPTVVLPPAQGVWFGRALVTLLIALPLLRVAWFVVRWFRRDDLRFAFVGLGVLCVVAVGALLS